MTSALSAGARFASGPTLHAARRAASARSACFLAHTPTVAPFSSTIVVCSSFLASQSRESRYIVPRTAFGSQSQ